VVTNLFLQLPRENPNQNSTGDGAVGRELQRHSPLQGALLQSLGESQESFLPSNIVLGHVCCLQNISKEYLAHICWNRTGPFRLGTGAGGAGGRSLGGVVIINWKLSSVAGNFGI
jgi:hypothetical protein